jgi:hypothetical protein
MKRLLFIFMLAMLSGCSENPDNNSGGLGKDVFLNSYVMAYFEAGQIHVYPQPKGMPLNETHTEFIEKSRIYIRLEGTHMENQRYGDYTSSLRGDVTGEKFYNAMCEKHGDMTFSRTLTIYNFHLKPRYSDADFLSIEVVSDADFDADHPAGTLLNNLLTANLLSAKPYIDSGYTEYDFFDDGLIKYSIINKSLVDISVNDLTLLGTGGAWYRVYGDEYIGSLIFEKEPTMSKTHTFTVTMTADDGRVFTDSIQMTFE